MVQISTRVLVATLAAAPILAAPLARSVEEGVSARDLSAGAQLEVREPSFRTFTTFVKPVQSTFPRGLDVREFDDAQLEVRAPIIGKIFGGIKSFLGFRRELEELDARELGDAELEVRAPFIGKIFGGIKNFLGFRRELEELDARELQEFEDILSRAFDEYSDDLAARGFDDAQLEVRAPFIGKIFGGIKNFLGFRRELDELDARELEEFEDTVTRAFDDYMDDLEARSIELEDVDARNYWDELD